MLTNQPIIDRTIDWPVRIFDILTSTHLVHSIIDFLAHQERFSLVHTHLYREEESSSFYRPDRYQFNPFVRVDSHFVDAHKADN